MLVNGSVNLLACFSSVGVTWSEAVWISPHVDSLVGGHVWRASGTLFECSMQIWEGDRTVQLTAALRSAVNVWQRVHCPRSQSSGLDPWFVTGSGASFQRQHAHASLPLERMCLTGEPPTMAVSLAIGHVVLFPPFDWGRPVFDFFIKTQCLQLAWGTITHSTFQWSDLVNWAVY